MIIKPTISAKLPSTLNTGPENKQHYLSAKQSACPTKNGLLPGKRAVTQQLAETAPRCRIRWQH